MNRLLYRMRLVALLYLSLASAQTQSVAERLRDHVTGREILRYASPQHETHHYYFVSPWSPDGSTVLFFQFDATVARLTATGRNAGSLILMKADGSERRELVGRLSGHYHTGVNQLWGPRGEFVYFQSCAPGPQCMARAPARGGELECMDTPVPCSRLSPDGALLSCGNAEHRGVFDLDDGHTGNSSHWPRPVASLRTGRRSRTRPPSCRTRGSARPAIG